MKEVWDLYNEKRELIGKTIERGKKFNEGEFYVAVEMWTINSKKQILVTQRHPDKKAGGFWEFSGGGVPSGENTKTAAKRELKEELGIDVNDNDIKYFSTCLIKNCFIDIFIIYKDFDLNSLMLQEGEVINAKCVNFCDIEKMIDEGIFVNSVANRFIANKQMVQKIIDNIS